MNPLSSFDKVSCLMITQVDRTHLIGRALTSFALQTLPERKKELVIVHHDGRSCSELIEEACRKAGVAATIMDVPKAPLGALRNISIQNSSGNLLCQWDDDDFYHPDRLLAQSAAFRDPNCVASTLAMQMCWFCDRGEIFIRTGGKEGIHGSIMVRGDAGCRYEPTLKRGEDSGYINQILAGGTDRIRRIDDRPELYVRRFHGGNTWDFEHHYKPLYKRASSATWLKANEQHIREWLDVLGVSNVAVRDCASVAFTI